MPNLAIRARDAIGLFDTPEPPGEDNDGLIVTNYDDYDPDDAMLQSIVLNSTVQNWGNNGGSSIAFETGPWWNGDNERIVTMRPPTIGDAGSGLGDIQLWKGATKVNRQANFRWEWMCSDSYCLNATNFPKWIIVRTYRELSVLATDPDRPMLFIENMMESSNPTIDIDNTIQFCPAQGTGRMYSLTNLTPAPRGNQWVDNTPGPTTYCAMQQPFYKRATAGTDNFGNPIIAASEILCTEMRINVMATADEPLGLIGMRTYRRDGSWFERCCSWLWDEEKTVNTNYIADIDNMGGGYYNVANNGSPDLWIRMGRMLTIALNYQPTLGRAWLGPPTGFYLV